MLWKLYHGPLFPVEFKENSLKKIPLISEAGYVPRQSIPLRVASLTPVSRPRFDSYSSSSSSSSSTSILLRLLV